MRRWITLGTKTAPRTRSNLAFATPIRNAGGNFRARNLFAIRSSPSARPGSPDLQRVALEIEPEGRDGDSLARTIPANPAGHPRVVPGGSRRLQGFRGRIRRDV